LFFAESEVWDERVAEWMAKNLEGVQQMTERHWKVVKYVRQYWETTAYAHQ
jgi:Dissimilatory sulfite reductase (desulfoviridin), gamma subunit